MRFDRKNPVRLRDGASVSLGAGESRRAPLEAVSPNGAWLERVSSRELAELGQTQQGVIPRGWGGSQVNLWSAQSRR